MSTQSLSVIVPVKEINSETLAALNNIAVSTSELDVIAIGGVALDKVKCSGNLRIVERNCGIYEAMNVGARASSSDYLLFMGVDDVLISSNVRAVIGGLAFLGGASMVVLPFRVGRRLVVQKPATGRIRSFHHQGVLFRRETLLQIGGYSEKYKLHSDLDLMFRVQRRGSVRALDTPLVKFSKGGTTTSGKYALQSIREFSAIYLDHQVSRMAFNYAFSVALLLWYRLRYLVQSALPPSRR